MKFKHNTFFEYMQYLQYEQKTVHLPKEYALYISHRNVLPTI